MSVSVVASPDPTISQLNALHGRREQGVPTVAVLVGPVGLGGRVWGEWNQSHGRGVIRTTGVGPEFALTLTEHLLSMGVAETAAVGWLAAVQCLTTADVVERLGRMTVYDFDQLWSRLSVDTGTPAAVAARATLAGRVSGRSPDATRWVRAVTAEANRATTVVVIDAWGGLLPDAHKPSLLFVPPAAHRDGPGWLGGVLRGWNRCSRRCPGGHWQWR